jgi:hypothetical protein
MACINHPAREEAWLCPQCQVAFCDDCVDVKMYGHVKIEVCPRCKDKVIKAESVRPAVPFWNRLPELFRYPLIDEGWIRVAVLGVVGIVLLGLAQLGVMSGTLIGILGALLLVGMYYGIIITYFYLVISKSEAGELKPPGWPSISGLSDLTWPAFQFILTTLVVFMPLLVFLFLLFGLSGFNEHQMAVYLKDPAILLLLGLLGLVGLAILPMGLLLLGVFRSVMNAWNPVIIFGQILKIPKEYFIALGFMLVLGLIYIGVQVGLFFFNVALGGGFFAAVMRIFIGSAVFFYFLVVLGHLLGYLAFQCRFQLGWWHDTRAPQRPVFIEPAATAHAQTHPDLVQGFRDFKLGAFERAEASFLAVLEQEPENPEAVKGLYSLALERQDEAGAMKLSARHLELCLRRPDLEAALAAFQEIRAKFPAPAWDPRVLFALAKGLREKQKYFEAAAVLRQFAVSYPDDPRAPKALYQCGELLLKQDGQQENARKIWEYLLKRYPGHELAPHVQAGLKQLQAP